MHKIGLFAQLFCLLLVFFSSVPAVPKTPDPKVLISISIAAMGGLDRLKAIKSIHSKSIGHTYLLEQSERPLGPWLVVYQETDEWRDVERGFIRRSYEQKGVFESKVFEIVADGISAADLGSGLVPGSNIIEQTAELLAMAPERVLINALDAPDLRYLGTETVQDSVNNVVSFTWKNSPVRIFINQSTNLLTMTDVVRARPNEQFWGIWGDFSEKNYYSFWNLEKGGLRYPRQVDTFYNGQPLKTNTITSIEFNAEAPREAFSIPEKIKVDFANSARRSFLEMPLGRTDRPPVDVAAGFTVIRGSWNVSIVKQDDGIVVIEAPISSNYSVKVIDEVKRRYPQDQIKCVISTSDAFPHFGGLRQYVAAGIPVYILDLNQPIINRLVSAKYATYPDNLEKDPARKRSKLNLVSKKTVIGSGTNRLELYPIRTETGERMIMIYAPRLKLLYGSDLVQPLPTGGFFMPQYISELQNAAERERLDVERVYAIHSPPLEWKKVLEALNVG
jgi:hypothetical protein